MKMAIYIQILCMFLNFHKNIIRQFAEQRIIEALFLNIQISVVLAKQLQSTDFT